MPGKKSKSILECRQILDDWKRSGLSVSKYCRENNIKLTSFRSYQQTEIKYLGNSELQAKFKEIEFPTTQDNPLQDPDSTEIKVSFGDSINVTLSNGFNPDEFSKVASVLNGILC